MLTKRIQGNYFRKGSCFLLYKNNRFKQVKQIIGLFAALFFLMPLPYHQAEARGSLTVLPFKAVSSARELGDILTNQLMADLSDNASVFLVDRSNIKDILDEQGLGKTGVIAKNTAVQMGRVQGVDYLLTGGVFSPQNIPLRKGMKAPVTRFNVSWKLLDTTTGQILLADTNSRDMPKTMVKKDGKRVWVTPPDAAGTALTGISHDISQSIQQRLVQCVDAVHVAFIDGSTIYIDGGSSKNIRVDDVFSIVQDGAAIRDPRSGKFLGYQQKVLCRIRIEHVDAELSYGRVSAGSSDRVKIGNVAVAS